MFKPKDSLLEAALNEILSRGAPILGTFSELTGMITGTIPGLITNFLHKLLGTVDHCLKISKTSDWMADVPDHTKLIHMSLPGTHDTCTCRSYHTLPCL